MLKWVTDHRAMFVRWGAAVANVLRAVLLVAKTLWEIFKKFLDAIGNSLQKALGTHFKSFEEFLNMLSFKIAAIIIWMGMLCKKLNLDFSEAFQWILEKGKEVIDFFVGLVKRLVELAVDTGVFTAAWDLLQAAINGVIAVGKTALESLESIVAMLLTPNTEGDNITTILQSLRGTVDALVATLELGIKNFTKGFKEATKEIATPVREIVDHITNIIEAFNSKKGAEAFKAFGFMIGTALNDAAKIVETVASNMETLITNLLKTGTITGMIELLTAAMNGVTSVSQNFINEVGKIINSLIMPNQEGHNLATIIDSLKKTIDTLTPALNLAITNFASGFQAAAGEIATPLTRIINRINEIIDLFNGKKGAEAFEAFGNLVGTALMNVAGLFQTLADNARTVMENLLKTGTLTSTINTLKSTLNGFTGIANTFVNNIGKIINKLAEPNKKSHNLNSIILELQNSIDKLTPAITGAIDSFTDGFLAGAGEIATPVQTIISQVTRMAESFNTREAKAGMRELGNIIGTSMQNGANIIAEVAKGLADIFAVFIKADSNGGNLATFLKSIGEFVTKMGELAKVSVKGFFEGFTGELEKGNIMSKLIEIVNKFNDLVKLITGEDSKGVQGAFKLLGSVIGGVINSIVSGVSFVMTLIVALVDTIKTVVDNGLNIIKTGQDLKAKWGGQSGYGAQLKKSGAGVLSSLLSPVQGFLGGIGLGDLIPVNDAIITKTGQVVQTDPDDTIIAAKQITGGGGKGNGKGGNTITITFGPTYVTVTEGDAEKAGRDFGQSMARTFADAISAEMLLEGY
jgi:uncharacterized protein YukE